MAPILLIGTSVSWWGAVALEQLERFVPARRPKPIAAVRAGSSMLPDRRTSAGGCLGLGDHSRLTRFLGLTAIGLTAVSAALRFAVSFLGFESGVGLVGGAAELFDVQNDKTIPTWFSSLLLLVAAILVWQLLRAGSTESWATRGPLLRTLTAGFLLMSIDETASIHEHLNEPLAKWVAPTGPFRFGWVVVGILIVILVVALFGRWVLSLPSPDRWWAILGGVLFVAGAIGFEMLGSELSTFQIHGVEGGVAHIEELFEMLGVVAFIEAMVRLLRRTGWDGQLRFAMLKESAQPTLTEPVAEAVES